MWLSSELVNLVEFCYGTTHCYVISLLMRYGNISMTMLTLIHVSPYRRAMSDWTGKYDLYSPTTLQEGVCPNRSYCNSGCKPGVIMYMSTNLYYNVHWNLIMYYSIFNYLDEYMLRKLVFLESIFDYIEGNGFMWVMELVIVISRKQ